MMQPPPAVPTPAPRPAGPGLAVSLVIGLVGLAVAIASAVAITIPFVATFTSTEFDVPATLRLHLDHARYTVYQRTGTSSGFGGVDRDPSAFRIPPSQVVVSAPDGSQVPVFLDSGSEQITRGTTVYSSSLVFDAPAGGQYTVRFTNPISTRVIIVRSIADAVRSVGIWIGTGASLGGLLLVLGVVMLIVGATRRGRQKRAAYWGWGGPPGGPGYGPPPAQWGTPGVTSPYPPQYPPASYPPPPPPRFPPAGYPPPPPPGPPPDA